MESDGTELVVVKRTDLDLERDPAARELAYADNRVAEVDLDWDVQQLEEDRAAGFNLEPFFTHDARIESLIMRDSTGRRTRPMNTENAFETEESEQAALPKTPREFHVDSDRAAEWILRILANNAAEKIRITAQA